MTDKILGRWAPVELLARGWNEEMASRFPNASHDCCRMRFAEKSADGWRYLDNPICVGLHCNRCGKPTDCQGGHDCPDRPA